MKKVIIISGPLSGFWLIHCRALISKHPTVEARRFGGLHQRVPNKQQEIERKTSCHM
jgi:hypothetical protein